MLLQEAWGLFCWYGKCTYHCHYATHKIETIMIDLNVIHGFLKDPLTDKLFHKYVHDPKARRVFDTSVRLVEIAIIALPLAMTAAKSIRDIVQGRESRSKSRLRRLIPA